LSDNKLEFKAVCPSCKKDLTDEDIYLSTNVNKENTNMLFFGAYYISDKYSWNCSFCRNPIFFRECEKCGVKTSEVGLTEVIEDEEVVKKTLCPTCESKYFMVM